MLKISDIQITAVPDYGISLDNRQFSGLVGELKKLFHDRVEVIDNDMQPLEKCRGRLLVVFGKAAMLTGVIRNKPVLYVDPEYVKDGEWAELFATDRKKAIAYYRAHTSGERPLAYVLPDGTFIKERLREPWRYGIFTTWDSYTHNHVEFEDRYPRNSLLDISLDGSPEGLARYIKDFADKKTREPLKEIEKSLFEFPRRDIDDDVICRFEHPIATSLGYVEDVEIDRSLEAALSGETVKVRCAETGLCAFGEFACRQDLEALSDAIAAERKRLLGEGIAPCARPHILLIPDYSESAQSAGVVELQRQLQLHCGETAVYYAGDSLEKSRLGVERVCKRQKFDLILTIGSGCLLATRVNNAHRLFINPEWAAWEEMKCRLSEDTERLEKRGMPGESVMPLHSHYHLNDTEIAEARRIAERSNIKHGNNLTMGWFTVLGTGNNLPEEHMKRFTSAAFPPRISVDDEDGVAMLCRHIKNLFLSMEEEK